LKNILKQEAAANKFTSLAAAVFPLSPVFNPALAGGDAEENGDVKEDGP
jgi:hypothetical protein